MFHLAGICVGVSSCGENGVSNPNTPMHRFINTFGFLLWNADEMCIFLTFSMSGRNLASIGLIRTTKCIGATTGYPAIHNGFITTY